MTKQDFEDLQLKFNGSGMTLKSFLHQEGVAYSTYNYWSRKTRTTSEIQPVAPISIREPGSECIGAAHIDRSVLLGVTLAFPNGLRTLIGKAVTYAYTRWDSMMRVLDDGRLLLDNNLAENEIRPITLGRKNYLFNGNHEAAENMCIITSLLATCRNHSVNPRLYLNDIIASMPYFEEASHEDLVMLLPHRWKEFHPEAIMTTPIRDLAK